MTPDGHASSPRAIREELGMDVVHRSNQSLHTRREQDHRGIKERYSPMRRFASVASASRFCPAFAEGRQFFRFRTPMKQKMSLAQQPEVFGRRWDALKAMVLVG